LNLNLDIFQVVFGLCFQQLLLALQRAGSTMRILQSRDAHGTATLLSLFTINQSINHYFIVRKKLTRAGQLSLPYVGIAKTERNRTKT